MPDSLARWLLPMLGSLFVALWLSALPMHDTWLWYRPAWPVLILVFWIILQPERIGLGLAWLLGLAQDLVAGTTPGQHALALTAVAFLALLLYQRLRMYSVWQQAGIVFLLVGIHQLIGHWVQNLTGVVAPNLKYLLPALTSALVWPLLAPWLRPMQRQLSQG
ncbi:MAG TPA: rod shape-determining protein MreD [Spongiibacteraceae bacterium]|jgi:rod shape-determining protein MreD|nr:rod shape-determining protein MreD [Spongiibacteraceae bacterium]HUH38487.1 rod shape-determining protein MreD [Spongiibacteraceae bacterium]